MRKLGTKTPVKDRSFASLQRAVARLEREKAALLASVTLLQSEFEAEIAEVERLELLVAERDEQVGALAISAVDVIAEMADEIEFYPRAEAAQASLVDSLLGRVRSRDEAIRLLCRDVESLKHERRHLSDVLSFYGSPENWETVGLRFSTATTRDRGAKARVALGFKAESKRRCLLRSCPQCNAVEAALA